jgi:hypothetical protein
LHFIGDRIKVEGHIKVEGKEGQVRSKIDKEQTLTPEN